MKEYLTHQEAYEAMFAFLEDYYNRSKSNEIANDVNIKGGVFDTDKAQGIIRGNVNTESLQDTATYDSNQKNMGFNLDVDLKGAGSSLSLNGAKTNINADYKIVGQQTGLFANEADLVVEDKGNFKGAVLNRPGIVGDLTF